MNWHAAIDKRCDELLDLVRKHEVESRRCAAVANYRQAADAASLAGYYGQALLELRRLQALARDAELEAAE